MQYEIVETNGFPDVLKRTSEEGQVSWIPINEANSDYQRYLAWLEDPNAETTLPIL